MSFLAEADVITAHHLSAVALDLVSKEYSTLDAVDSVLVERLRAGARHDAMLAISAEATSTTALRSLIAHDIPVLVMKGPATARFHPDPTKRTYSDLDLLVSPHLFRDAVDVLVDLGYVRKRDSEHMWPAFDRHCVEGFNFHLSPHGNIDLHHHVSPWRFGRQLDFKTLVGRSDRGEVVGVPVRFASAGDSLAISCLHVVNDLGKDTPSFNSWRDIAILFNHLGPAGFAEAFKDAGLEWFEAFIWAALTDLGANTNQVGIRPIDPRFRWQGERLRLGLMGWNASSFLARHPLGWALRLPNLRALYFLLGAAIPSPGYVRSRYPDYRSYWRDARSSVLAAVRGSDFRHDRIGPVNESGEKLSLPGDELDGS
jgi:hypothetical protein